MIYLTSASGEKVLVNPQQIAYVMPSVDPMNKTNIVVFPGADDDNGWLRVKESMDDIWRLTSGYIKMPNDEWVK